MSSVIRATALAEALYTAALKAGAKPATIARAIVYHGDNTKAGMIVETANGPVPYAKAVRSPFPGVGAAPHKHPPRAQVNAPTASSSGCAGGSREP